MHPIQPYPGSTPPPGAAGFSALAGALRTAARKIDTAVSDAQKLQLPDPPSTSTVGDSQLAQELGTSFRLHAQSCRKALSSMRAMSDALLATERDYTRTESDNTDRFSHPDHGQPGPGHPAPAPTPTPGSRPGAGHGGGHDGTGHDGPGGGQGGPGGAGQGGTTPPGVARPDWPVTPPDPNHPPTRTVSAPGTAPRGPLADGRWPR
jgi:hypothetical protein